MGWLRGGGALAAQSLPEAHSGGSVSGQLCFLKTIPQMLVASGLQGAAWSLQAASHRPVVLAPGCLDTHGKREVGREEVAPLPGTPPGTCPHTPHASCQMKSQLLGEPRE